MARPHQLTRSAARTRRGTANGGRGGVDAVGVGMRAGVLKRGEDPVDTSEAPVIRTGASAGSCRAYSGANAWKNSGKVPRTPSATRMSATVSALRDSMARSLYRKCRTTQEMSQITTA